MKRITALLILVGLLLSSPVSFSSYASGEQEDATSPEQAAPTDSSTESADTDSPVAEETDPPATDDDPSTEPLPPDTEEPPATEESPETEDPPVVDYDALLFEGLTAAVDGGETLYSLSTPEPLETELLQAVCTRAMERVARFFYLQAVDISIVTLPAPDEDGNLYRYDLRPIYSIAPGEELDAAKAFVEQETAAIIAKIPDGTTEMEKVLFLHDYLCTTFAYDGTHTVGDLYNLLQSGHGVCRAYVALYAYLLDLIGIPNDFAVSAEMNHIWNIVELDGSWYHVDLTRDDPTADHPGRALHGGFLRSDAGIAEVGHYGWIAPYVCDSDLYETSFLTDLTGAVLFLSDARYAISKSTRALLKVDFNELSAETVADLSLLRWEVWEKPGSLYKDQFINLCYDGYLIYFNGPDTIWSFDPATRELTALLSHHPSAGYLYSLSIEGHALISQIGKAPGSAAVTVRYDTPHRFGASEGELFTLRSCLLCGYQERSLTPTDGSFVTALLSHRAAGDTTHDIRLLLLVNDELLTASSPLQIVLTLHSSDGDRSVTTVLSASDHGKLLIYEQIVAGGKEYSPAEGYNLLGLILRNLDNGSYDAISLTVSNDEAQLYRARLSAETLFPSPTPDTDEPATNEPSTEIETETTSEGSSPATDNPDTTDTTDGADVADVAD